MKNILINKINSLSTAMLFDIARKLNLSTDNESMYLVDLVENELEKRISTEEFIGFMTELESQLC